MTIIECFNDFRNNNLENGVKRGKMGRKDMNIGENKMNKKRDLSTLLSILQLFFLFLFIVYFMIFECFNDF